MTILITSNQNPKRNWVTPALLLVLSLILVMSIKECKEIRQVKKGLIERYKNSPAVNESDLKSEQKEWIDENRKLHLVLETQEMEAESFKKFAQAEIASLKLKNKQVKTITKTEFQTEVIQQIMWDTLLTYVPVGSGYSYRDEYITLLIDTNGLKLHMWDTLRHVTYWKRKNIFSKPVTYTDVFNESPYTKLKLSYTVSKTVKQPKILIGPSVGASYSPLKNSIRPTIGVSMLYYPLTLKF